MKSFNRPIEVLLVEDNPGDVRLVSEALKNGSGGCRLHVVSDGKEALGFLSRLGEYSEAPRPDLVLLDLKIPKKSGLEVLESIKGDPGLKRIPVVVLTSSEAEEDIRRAYDLNANCYVSKRLELQEYFAAVRSVRDFWFNVVNLPPSE